jgi:hypothetical protein
LFQGDTIQVSIGPEEFKKRKPEIDELMKMETHVIKNFRVMKNQDKYKFTEHAFKLNFISGTSVKPLEIPDMPVSGYKFKKFEEVQALTFREDLLYGKFCFSILYLLWYIFTSYSKSNYFLFNIRFNAMVDH